MKGGRSVTAGYGLVLVGAFGFAVGCFLPYFDPGVGEPLSLWGLYTIESSAAETIGSVLILFTGSATLVGITLVGLLRRPPWTVTALISVSIVWSLMWIGNLVNSATRSNTEMAVAYWLMLVCIGLVLIGATVVTLSTRGARSSNETTTASSEPGPPGNV